MKLSDYLNAECQIYKNSQGFLRLGVGSATKKIDGGSEEFTYKAALLISYAGLLLLLKSILRASVNKEHSDTVLSAKQNITFKDDLVILLPDDKTVDKYELFSRLKNRGFELSAVEGEAIRVGKIRNDIEHKYSSKTIAEVVDASISIFEIINLIIDNNQSRFWGDDLWLTLCELEKIKKSLQEKCNNSYQNNAFLPNEYFKCLDCHSRLLEIKDMQLDCLRCGSHKSKLDLIKSLSDSGCYAETHAVISCLMSFKNFNEDEKIRIKKIREENTQVMWIIDDEDVEKFYESLA